jgi:hypothetical protein
VSRNLPEEMNLSLNRMVNYWVHKCPGILYVIMLWNLLGTSEKTHK